MNKEITIIMAAAAKIQREFDDLSKRFEEMQEKDIWQSKTSGDQLIRKDMRYVALLEFRPGMNTKFKPPFSYIEWTNGTLAQDECITRVDENGFMVSERPYTEGDSKVMLLGSSPIESGFVREDARISTRIEDGLIEKGKNVKVYNASVSYSHLLHMLNVFVNKGLALRPTCLVLYIAVRDDVRANGFRNSFWSDHTEIATVRKVSKDRLNEAPHTLHNVNEFDDHRRLLQTFCDICTNFGVQLFIATWPLYGNYDGYLSARNMDPLVFEREWAQAKLLNTLVREVVSDKGCGIIDLEKEFEGLNHHDYFYDEYHPNVKGSDLIASLTTTVISAHL